MKINSNLKYDLFPNYYSKIFLTTNQTFVFIYTPIANLFTMLQYFI